MEQEPVEFAGGPGYRNILELEAHVSPMLDNTADSGKCSARVTHIVIRLDTDTWRLQRPFAVFDGLDPASVEGPLTELRYIRAVTLETIDREESADLIDKFPIFHRTSKLHRRACKDSQELAQRASHDPDNYSENQGVVSPMWYSDDHEDWERRAWCVNGTLP